MANHKATGQFSKRADLEMYVWVEYHNKGTSMNNIARRAEVSCPCVSEILKGTPPPNWEQGA